VINFLLVGRVRLIIIILGVSGIAVLVTLFIIGNFKPKVGGILINTNPSSLVIINGEEVGRTPYEDKREPEEITLKLIPDSFDVPLEPYEVRVNVVAGVLTVVKRDFGEVEETSGGEIISFESVSGDETSLVVVSIPDSAQLLIDGHQQAVTPYKLTDIEPGEHTLQLTANGYLDRIVSVKAHRGYKLTAIVQLASTGVIVKEEEKVSDVVEEEDIKPKEEKIPQVVILETPNNFLNVRAKPVDGEVLTKVRDGERYDLLDTDKVTGWYKIEYEEGEEGWVSDDYVEEVEGDEDLTPTVTPTASLTPKTSPTSQDEE